MNCTAIGQRNDAECTILVFKSIWRSFDGNGEGEQSEKNYLPCSCQNARWSSLFKTQRLNMPSRILHNGNTATLLSPCFKILGRPGTGEGADFFKTRTPGRHIIKKIPRVDLCDLLDQRNEVSRKQVFDTYQWVWIRKKEHCWTSGICGGSSLVCSDQKSSKTGQGLHLLLCDT